MRHKLTPAERADRIEHRAKARADRAAASESIRDWFEARRLAAQKRHTETRQARLAQPRGVDRVPARYHVQVPAPEYVVEHTAAPYRDRRAWALGQGRNLPAAGNTPHVNVWRDYKPGARIRKDLP